MSHLSQAGYLEHRRNFKVRTATAAPRFRRSGRSRQSGFSMVEILIVVAIILTLGAIAIPRYLTAVNQARISRAAGDIRTIGNQVLGYEVINQVFPTSLSQAGFPSNLDPWGQPYQYLNFATNTNPSAVRVDRFNVPLNSYFDLYSTGQDMQSAPSLTAAVSQDDIVWAGDGSFDGLATTY